ncbi:MAG: hypothetical protein U0575_14950 [Phycisphaerales bacterium]
MARDGSLPIPLAFALALAVHAGGFALLAHARPGEGDVEVIRGDIAPEDVKAAHVPDPDDLTLGIEAKTPSSMTWIGYDEFVEQIAQHSEVEQAAFDDDPSAGAGGQVPTDESVPVPMPPSVAAAAPGGEPGGATADGADQPPSPPVEPAAASPEATTQPSATAPPPAETSATTTAPPLEGTSNEAAQATPAEKPSNDPTIVAPPALPPDPIASSAMTPVLPANGELPLIVPVVDGFKGMWIFGRSIEADAPPIADGAMATQPDATTPRADSPGAGDGGHAPTASGEGAAHGAPGAAPDDPAQPNQPGRSGQPGSSTAGSEASGPNATPSSASAPPAAPGPPVNRAHADGAQADRESDATSVVDVPPDQWKRGKPLAASGLEIKTRRPVFPELTRLTAAPGNPVVEIFFDRTGVPRKANIVRSSGDPRIDGPVVDSLYRWRASGSQLARLREGETMRIEMRLMLGGG